MNKVIKNKKTRDGYLDVLKGVAICLVVFGHAIQSASPDFDANPIFRLIYSFHMPLFIFLSGAVASYSKRPLNMDYIKNKLSTLLLPFFAWAVVGYFLTNSHNTRSILSHIWRAVTLPDTGLWFLVVLFWLSCILFLFTRANRIFGSAGYVAVMLVVYSVPTSKFGMGLVKWHLPFFFAGYFIFKYANILARYRKAVLYICAAVFPFIVVTWYRTKNPVFASWIEPRLSAHNLTTISIGENLTLNIYLLVITVYKYAVGFAGIGAVFFWMQYLYRLRPIRRVFNYLSGYTLDIYAMSNYCLFIGFGSYYAFIFTATLAGVIVPVIVSVIFIRRFSILRRLLLGGR